MTHDNPRMGDLNELVERLLDWLVERGLPDSGIRYEGSYSGDGVRRQARVELYGEDATFVASHFHGAGASRLAAALTSLIAERDHVEALLRGRDTFIVDQGLWTAFVATLPLNPPRTALSLDTNKGEGV